MTKTIKFISCVVLSLFIIGSANAGTVQIGKKSVETTEIGSITSDYVSIIISSTDATEEDFSQANITSLVLLIPNEIFLNGTYDLAALPADATTLDEAVEACEAVSEASDDLFDLPSTDKVYFVGSSLKLTRTDKFDSGKGLSIAEKGFKNAKITISGIGSNSASPLIEDVTVNIDAQKIPARRINYKIPKTEDCEQIAKKGKFKASKIKKAKVTVDATALVFDASVTGIPNF